MFDLHLTRFNKDLRVKTEADKRLLWDPIRKIWLSLAPEELVRQLFVQYLIQEKGYNKHRMVLEKQLKVSNRMKRFDILTYNSTMQPWLMVECKAMQVPINREVFFQIAQYNLVLQVPYLVLTNGLYTFCCALDYEAGRVVELDQIPAFPE